MAAKDAATDNTDLRQEAGRWLQSRRERAGVSQRQLAKMIGVKYYTFISQVESGRARIPPERYKDWANALGISAAEFVREIMRYYEPIAYELLFAQSQEVQPTSQALAEIHQPGADRLGIRELQRPMRELHAVLTHMSIENNTMRQLLRQNGIVV